MSFAQNIEIHLAFVLLVMITTPQMVKTAKINRNCTADCTCEIIEESYLRNILVVECGKRDTISEIPRLDPDLMANVTEL